jgi:hypothetical protein
MLRRPFVRALAGFAASLAAGLPAARASDRFTYLFDWELQPAVEVGDVAGLSPLQLKAGPEIVMTLPVEALPRLQQWFGDVDRRVASARKSGTIVVSNEFGAEIAHFHFDRMLPVGFGDAERRATAPVRVRFRYGSVNATK